MAELPPDGALSGEPAGVGDDDEQELDPEQIAAMKAAMSRMMQPQQQVFMCASCMNNHKIAIAELSQKLQRQGYAPGTQEHQQALQAAAQAGAMFAQNPMAAQGMNGDKPDMIPPVRPADLMINGNSVCAFCFQAQKQTSVLAAPGGWTPGR